MSLSVKTVRAAAAAAAGIPLLALAACGSGGSSDAAATGKSGGKKVSVVASTNVWGDIAARVGGDRVHVTSIISNPNQDPHGFEANTRNQLELAKAQLVVRNGGGYDDFATSMLKSAKNDKARIVDAVAVSGKKGPDLNEHVWYDFSTTAAVADRIAGDLSAIDPAGAKTYRARAAALGKQLTALQATEAKIKKEHGGDPIAITEPVPLYLTAAAGLANRTPAEFSEAVEEGSDVSPRALDGQLGLFDHHRVKALVLNAQTADGATRKSEAAAKKNRIPVVRVTETLPAGQTYPTWMRGNLDALNAALGGGR